MKNLFVATLLSLFVIPTALAEGECAVDVCEATGGWAGGPDSCDVGQVRCTTQEEEECWEDDGLWFCETSVGSWCIDDPCACPDEDGDGVCGDADLCPTDDATSFDYNGDGCSDDEYDVVDYLNDSLTEVLNELADTSTATCEHDDDIEKVEDKILDALDKAEEAIEKEDGHKLKDAIKKIKDAIKELGDAEDDGCGDFTALKQQLTDIARTATVTLINTSGAPSDDVRDAWDHGDEGDAEAAAGDYKKAVEEYEDAVKEIENDLF